jgi:two-component system, CitB family, response regulator
MTGTQREWLVLIVEDDPRIAEINRRFVEKVPGFKVVGIATSLGQAKEQLDVLQPDLVLLDIHFPEESGLDLLREVQETNAETDFIAVTAAKEVHTVREAMRGGVFDFLVKPVVFERFQKTLLDYRKWREHVERLKAERPTIEQEEIDRLLRGGTQPAAKESALPKGIDKLTLEKVTAVISRATGDLTTEEVGREIGASRSTARRYLEYLVAQGDVQADLSYGVGRPERVYRAVDGK